MDHSSATTTTKHPKENTALRSFSHNLEPCAARFFQCGKVCKTSGKSTSGFLEKVETSETMCRRPRSAPCCLLGRRPAPMCSSAAPWSYHPNLAALSRQTRASVRLPSLSQNARFSSRTGIAPGARPRSWVFMSAAPPPPGRH